MYKYLASILEKFIERKVLLKYGFNLSSVYRRSTGRVTFVSEDLQTIKIKIPLSYKNSNYLGTMFGGAMSSATDPIYMIQLITILGSNYVVWDKAASIKFKRPGNQTLYADFKISKEFIEEIKNNVKLNNETQYNLKVDLKDKDGNVYAEVEREIYIASKAYYKTKRKNALQQRL